MAARSLNIAKKDSSRTFADFLNDFQKRVLLRPMESNKFRIQLKKDMPGVFNLFDTFPSANYHTNRFDAEWNPFSQRPSYRKLYAEEHPMHFDNASDTFEKFIEAAHESVHVLMWEPLFSGNAKPPSRNQFIEMSLAFEGYCFFYADIIITRDLRTKLPDGEFVKSRSAASQPLFHPYRVFKGLNIESLDEILKIYLDCFTGHQTVLVDKAHNPFAGNLLSRFFNFYIDNQKPLKLLFSELSNMNCFNEFYSRFCSISNLPTLLPTSILEMDYLKDPRQYCMAIYKTGHKFIENLSEEEITKVRLRRYIQTRAYSAYSLLYVLKNEKIFSRKNIRFNSTEIIKYLNNYIDNLETIILALCNDKKNSYIKNLCEQSDRFYSKKILPFFQSKDLWMLQRTYILPNINTKTNSMGIISKSTSINKQTAIKLTRAIVKLFFKEKFESMSKSKSIDELMLSPEMVIFFDSLSNLKGKWAAKNEQTWKKSFNKLLMSPEVLKSWSVSLSTINPEANTFSELFIRYF